MACWRSVSALLLAGALSAAACGGSGGSAAEVTIPASPDDAASATSADGPVGATSSSASVAAEEEDGGGDDGEPTSQGPGVEPVRFENGEHLDGEPIDGDLVRAKLEEVAVAARAAWVDCMTDPGPCEFERDVGPFVSGSEADYLRRVYDTQLVEAGARYRPDERNVQAVVDVSFNNEPPVAGVVKLCMLDYGVMYVPADGDRPEEILDDRFGGALHTYVVFQDENGVLRVDQAERRFEEGDEAFCDGYS